MRHSIPIIAAALAFALGACSQHGGQSVAAEAKDTGNALGATAQDLAHDRNLKRAEADLKRIGHDLGSQARSSGADMRAAGNDLAASAKRAAHDIKGDNPPPKDRDRDSNG